MPRWFSSGAAEEPKGAPASSSQLPPDHPPVPDGIDKCPVDDSARSVWMQAGASAPHPMASASSSTTPSTSKARLSGEREISSIPRSESSTYTHKEEQASLPAKGEEETGNWVYPSEQQFFNAMLRKNHNPQAKDMRTIVPIHNAVNEKAWEDVLLWEAGMGADRCGGPRLTSFVGRPKDRSPKAWIKTVFGYTPPFDRHDWIVDRCGTHVRYVIDFYTGRSNPNFPGAPTFYLDVRPALDSWEGIRTRWAGLWR